MPPTLGCRDRRSLVSRLCPRFGRRLRGVYTVKHAATMTGISPATLRMWERRYDVVDPAAARPATGCTTTPPCAGCRRCTPWSRPAGRRGWRPSRSSPGPPPAPRRDPERRAAARHGARPAGTRRRSPGSPSDFDGAALSDDPRPGLRGGSFEDVVDGWLMPALHRLGVAWHRGAVSVAGEHFVSAAVHRRLAAVLDALPAPDGRTPGGRRPGPGLAARARRAGLRRRCCGGPALDVVYVGGDLPPESWVVARSTVTVPTPSCSACRPPTTSPRCARPSPRSPRPSPTCRSTSAGATRTPSAAAAQPLGHALGAAAARSPPTWPPEASGQSNSSLSQLSFFLRWGCCVASGCE